ncbi:MAG: GSU2403 family nucleotidyltransferase fold protein [Myxococcota bacterium]
MLPSLNKHIDHKSQRRAADLVVVGPNGKTFRTDGKSNADYLAYGQKVLAVGDGTVVTAIDGVPDNAPGTVVGQCGNTTEAHIQQRPLCLGYTNNRLALVYLAMTRFDDLSVAAQTGYAQLLEACLGAEHLRSVVDLPGSFASKIVKGHKYWYLQYTEPAGKLRQVYVGPNVPAVRELIRRKQAKAPGAAAIKALARSALALGCTGIPPRQFRVIRRLADYGFFKAGGLLIGTHAFLAYGNMLGVRWRNASRTQDVDFAHAGRSIALLLPSNVEVQVPEAIQSLNMGFLPITGLLGKTGATYLVPREPAFRLDFLTTLHRGGDEPYVHPQLHVTLQPVKFMELSLEEVQQAVLFCEEGAVLVNVPHPARFALHKLLVEGIRTGTFAAKALKDRAQAAQLLAYLQLHRKEEVEEVWKDVCGRGKGWATRALAGLKAVARENPDLELESWLQAQDV